MHHPLEIVLVRNQCEKAETLQYVQIPAWPLSMTIMVLSITQLMLNGADNICHFQRQKSRADVLRNIKSLATFVEFLHIAL